jgi:hypothetical protein
MKNFKHWLENNQTILSGWLSPSGKFYECKRRIFDHLGVIENTPEIRKSMPDWFEKKINQLNQSKETSQELMRTGEHPEWHHYDMLHDSIEEIVYDEMYKKGYLRVAQSQDVVYFEGSSNGIKNLYQKAKDLAESHGKTASFQKIDV